MIRTILWKEWREHRGKYLGYWLTINAPIVLLVLTIGLTMGARTPFADLSDALVMKYLPLSLSQAVAVVTIFLIATGYLAVATFSSEIDDRSLFFIFEQPLSRRKYLTIKLLNGAAHVVLATGCSILLLPTVSYLMMLASGKVTTAGSGGAYTLVMTVAFRAAIWGALISAATFSASALISALIPRWWLAAISSIVLTVLFLDYGLDYFKFLPDMPDNSMSIGFSLSTGNSQWITISRALTSTELSAIAQWWVGPLLTTMALIAAFSLATAMLYDRKELT